MIFSIL